ncbi:MAG: hypothetical protein A3G34_03140 [Candidatus Lindowbacteria bacterium RIFCSPLOWO2_12_FULL_62_27]|nr:MAG: hypothetical protein A3I06_08275 [Candidatus Lindowbacteria bacterium RIFCSPLOWO2_02_FULL_62_12]OGH59292.1 MAG: hypothetical protein A3G34_03140 [Candidatus Lindowbacteria bacterium RIFCSPLOWO2_12_FULL_62_27]
MEIAPALVNLAKVRQAIGAHTQMLRIDPSAVYQITLAVEEACSNIIRHARRDARPLSLEIEATNRCIQVLIKGVGGPFDLERYPSSTAVREAVKNRIRSGYGIHLIKSLVDEYKYVLNGKGAPDLLLVKHLDGDKKTEVSNRV